MDTEPCILDAAVTAEPIRALAEKLRTNYVFPEVAEQICANLQKHLEDGDYSDIAEGEFLALALTLHMQEINRDEHLWVRWHPEPLPEDDGQLRLNPEWQAERRLEARLDNYGLYKVERLPGNIGYLDIHYFHRPEWGSDAAAAAMTFLVDTNALILDLRQCTGGFPGMVALLCSYLFGEEPVPVVSIYWHDEDKTQEFWTQASVAGRRFGDKPVYVLTSRTTFSAGELCADFLQTRRRASVIGGKTDGGAHPGASYRLHPHFEVFIPIGRTINPLTGTDWEGTGITPDISVPQEQAFQAAYHMALETVLSGLGEAPAGPLQALDKEVRAALQDMEKDQIICQKCGYPNPLYRNHCKNCDETLDNPDRRETQ